VSQGVAAVERTLEQGGDPDDLLRSVVAALVGEGGCAWAGILFAEEGELVLGPQAGTPAGKRRAVPVEFQGVRVAELAADGAPDDGSLTRIASLIAPYCLVGWDTGGVPWDGEATSG
jgi:hypothetical protein